MPTETVNDDPLSLINHSRLSVSTIKSSSNFEDCFDNISSLVSYDSEGGNEENLRDKLENIAGYRTVKNCRQRRDKNPFRTTLLIGDSMIRNIKGKKLANKLSRRKVFVRPHGGYKIGDIEYHVIPETDHRDHPPNHIIVHVGTNEIAC